MSALRDYHVHTTYSDGVSTPRQVVEAALAMGLTELGFSDHSYTFFDESYCITRDRIPAYRAEIAALREEYRGRLTILCGIEQDYYSAAPTDGYDYVIGSVHYIRAGGEYIPVDDSPVILHQAAENCFGGDIYALVEEYYRTVAGVAEKTGCDIIGHFDLITKFIEKEPLFDVAHPRYRRAWQAAADRLLLSGKPFEINTGAISRGYRTAPYPAAEIREYLHSRGGRFLLSSDSHRADTLCYGFDAFSCP